MNIVQSKPGYLEGQLLVATPNVAGTCFARSVIYVCVHNENGAMGIIINQPIQNISAKNLFEQLQLQPELSVSALPVYFGGPVDTRHGFILHTNDYVREDSLVKGAMFSLTSNVNILKDLSEGKGPKNALLVLGYAGWAAGQLEGEIAQNSWITVPSTHELVFQVDNDAKWERAAASLGVDMFRLSHSAGHA